MLEQHLHVQRRPQHRRVNAGLRGLSFGIGEPAQDARGRIQIRALPAQLHDVANARGFSGFRQRAVPRYELRAEWSGQNRGLDTFECALVLGRVGNIGDYYFDRGLTGTLAAGFSSRGPRRRCEQ